MKFGCSESMAYFLLWVGPVEISSQGVSFCLAFVFSGILIDRLKPEHTAFLDCIKWHRALPGVFWVSQGLRLKFQKPGKASVGPF